MDYPLTFISGFAARFRYCNYKGVVAERHVMPIQLWRGSTEYHPEEGWLLRAYCYDREEMRDFALDGIDDWKVEPPSEDDQPRLDMASAIPINLGDPAESDPDQFAFTLGRGLAQLTREICERTDMPPTIAIRALMSASAQIASMTGMLDEYARSLDLMRRITGAIAADLGEQADHQAAGGMVH